MRIVSLQTIKDFAPEAELFDSSSLPTETALLGGVYPPLVIVDGCLLWGKHIFEALKVLNIGQATTIDAKDVATAAAGETEEEAVSRMVDRVVLVLSLENRPGMFNWSEKERIYRHLEKFGILSRNDGEMLRKISSLIEKKGDFFSLTRQYAGLNAVAKRMVDENAEGGKQVDLKTVLAASNVPEAALALLHYYPGRLSFSQRRLILTFLSEIAKRGDLADDDIETLFHEVLSAKEPVADATRRRYPTLTSMEEQFHQKRTAVFGKSGIGMTAPENFEGENFSICFRFSSKKQFSKRLAVLNAAEKKIDEFFDILQQD